ncbi:MAG TPA: aldose 1-epimerase [Roseiarcus sp.]|nr:aldose 1-epimerase [Roseiarcus sp.]
MTDADRRRIVLSDGAAEAVVLPWLGAGLERYDLIARGRREALFRAAPPSASEPFALANILLAPWSNRISGGGFHFGGAFHRLEPNIAGEPFPIHGNAFSSPWRVKEEGSAHAALLLSSAGPGPFRYDAEATYALAGGALTMTLAIVNRAGLPLPYGLGFHPWLPRTPDVLLTAPAQGVWLEDGRHLPTGRLATAERPEWDFSKPRPLPARWINNAFDGWRGSAVISWPSRRLSLAVEAGPGLNVYIVYSPNGDPNFFCFEPVSHPVDAHNLGRSAGLVALAPGETVEVTCRFVPKSA